MREKRIYLLYAKNAVCGNLGHPINQSLLKMKQKNFFSLNFLLTILFPLIFIYSCRPKDKTGCSNFKSGTFTYGEKEWTTVKIFRDNNSQVEILGDTLKAYFTIRWTGDCTYDLTADTVVYNSESHPLDIKTLHVTITEILNDSTYHYTSIGGEEGNNEGTIIKLSDSTK
jgi:hypothetical protein